jgi:serine/threonine protein kinase
MAQLVGRGLDWKSCVVRGRKCTSVPIDPNPNVQMVTKILTNKDEFIREKNKVFAIHNAANLNNIQGKSQLVYPTGFCVVDSLSEDVMTVCKLKHGSEMYLMEMPEVVGGRTLEELYEDMDKTKKAKTDGSGYVRKYPDLTEADSKQVFSDIVAGLSFLHGNNLSHGDVKPGNIVISRHVEPARAFLIDFGENQNAATDVQNMKNVVRPLGHITVESVYKHQLLAEKGKSVSSIHGLDTLDVKAAMSPRGYTGRPRFMPSPSEASTSRARKVGRPLFGSPTSPKVEKSLFGSPSRSSPRSGDENRPPPNKKQSPSSRSPPINRRFDFD